MANLLIIESSGKKKTLEAILGKEWKVVASKGHIQKLPSDSLGINLETMSCEYLLTQSGEKFINNIKSSLHRYKRIVLATDPDREGEAISEHIRLCLNLNKYERCTFDEITKEAVLKALENPRQIDQGRVAAQDSRRLIDRLVGYKCTEAVSAKAGIRMVVGRVQSPALMLVAQRDEEIKNFEAEDHYSVSVITGNNWKCNLDVTASGLGDVVEENDEGKPTKRRWRERDEAVQLTQDIFELQISKLDSKTKNTPPPNPFKTSTFQQACFNKLRLPAEKAMAIATDLYNMGLITYIRTDSVKMSDEGWSKLAEYVKRRRSELSLSPSKREPTGKELVFTQEAHECIRPTNFFIDRIHEDMFFKKEHVAVYRLIHDRTIASQLEDSVRSSVKVTLVGKTNTTPINYVFHARFGNDIFLGWKGINVNADKLSDEDYDAILDEEESDIMEEELSNISIGEVLEIEEAEIVKKTTKGPSLYTESELTQKLESFGVGRPSTYQHICSKLDTKKGHGYIETIKGSRSNSKSYITTTKKGRILCETIADNLGRTVLGINYTSEMESSLDKISKNVVDKKDALQEFVETLFEINKEIASQPNHLCRNKNCNGSLVQRYSKKKNIYFWRCTNSNKGCDFFSLDVNGEPGESTREVYDRLKDVYSNGDTTPKHSCPQCNGHLILLEGKNGRYWRCYNKIVNGCDYTASNTQTKNTTESGEHEVIEKPVGDITNFQCKKCNSVLLQKISANNRVYYHCSNKKCAARYFWTSGGPGRPMKPKRRLN